MNMTRALPEQDFARPDSSTDALNQVLVAAFTNHLSTPRVNPPSPSAARRGSPLGKQLSPKALLQQILGKLQSFSQQAQQPSQHNEQQPPCQQPVPPHEQPSSNGAGVYANGSFSEGSPGNITADLPRSFPGRASSSGDSGEAGLAESLPFDLHSAEEQSQAQVLSSWSPFFLSWPIAELCASKSGSAGACPDSVVLLVSITRISYSVLCNYGLVRPVCNRKGKAHSGAR